MKALLKKFITKLCTFVSLRGGGNIWKRRKMQLFVPIYREYEHWEQLPF